MDNQQPNLKNEDEQRTPGAATPPAVAAILVAIEKDNNSDCNSTRSRSGGRFIDHLNRLGRISRDLMVAHLATLWISSTFCTARGMMQNGHRTSLLPHPPYVCRKKSPLSYDRNYAIGARNT